MRARAPGPPQHLTLVRETDIMRTIALRKSPPDARAVIQRCRLISTQSAEMQRCRVAHNLPPISRWD